RNPDTLVYLPEVEYIKYKNNPEESEERERALLAKVEADDGDAVPEIPDVQTFVCAEDEHRLDTMFSGEERLGRYVDLHEQHELYLNLKDSGRPSYLEYLAELHRFEAYPRRHKQQAEYARYLANLREYFEGFFERAMPLFDVSKAREEASAKFAYEWADRKVSGWEAEAAPAIGDAQAGDLFCAACNKQFEKSTTLAAHMNSRKHQKAVLRMADAPPAEKQDEAERQTALDECIVRLYVQILGDKIRDTRANVQRRQALTEEERDQEIDEEEHVFVDDKEDRDEQIYNPLNLPMGWDGKPIPYWLYKLHGLGVKFSCEICGNSVYRGRK
ncbi:Pre-mRNA-splicing factor sap61, partial [Coemansia sp. RSA 2424]